MAADLPATSDAGQGVRVAVSLCDRLGLADALKQSRRLIARAEQLGELVRREQVAARQRRGEAMRALVTGDGPVDRAQVLGVLAATDPWIDHQSDPPRSAHTVELVMEAARACHGNAYAAAVGEGPSLYRRLQAVAAESVKAVTKQPPLSRRTWGSADPASQAALDGYEAAWAVLVREQDRFALVHQLGQVIRSMGGLGASALLPGGAPDWGYAYRQWAKAMEGEQELKRLHPALRLRFAVDHGWDPGWYLADDLVLPEPQGVRRGLVGLLIPSPLRSPG